MIEIRDVTFRYAEKDADDALRALSLSLNSGECVALMGANGSGKTTLARCMNGLLLPDSGQVIVDGLPLKNSENIFEIRRRVGMVFQNPDNQIVSTTVRREIAFGLENLGIPHDEMVRTVEEMLERFHLTHSGDLPPHLLSGGERQRLALASVWAMQPRYLILDEPTSLLDPVDRKALLRFIREEKITHGIGVLLVTQFSDEALDCDRLIVLDHGKIVLSGAPRDVFAEKDAIRSLGLQVPVEIALSDYLSDLF